MSNHTSRVYSLEYGQVSWIEMQARIYKIPQSEVVRRALVSAMRGHQSPSTQIREVQVDRVVEKIVNVEHEVRVRESARSFDERCTRALQAELREWDYPGRPTVARIVRSFLRHLKDA